MSYRHTRLYNIWRGIVRRCFHRSCKEFNNYGGRGITLCSEWRHKFLTFQTWANAAGYNDKLVIDRIDNDGDYGPGNCRWTTHKRNNRNRRDTVIIEFRGERTTMPDLAERFGIPYERIRLRLRWGWSAEDAVTLPKNTNRKRHYGTKPTEDTDVSRETGGEG